MSKRANVPNLKFATAGELQIRDTSSLFSVACRSQKSVAERDELLGQDTSPVLQQTRGARMRLYHQTRQESLTQVAGGASNG